MSLYGFAHLQRKTLTIKLLEKPTLRENFGFRETDVKMGDETYLYDIFLFQKRRQNVVKSYKAILHYEFLLSINVDALQCFLNYRPLLAAQWLNTFGRTTATK